MTRNTFITNFYLFIIVDMLLFFVLSFSFLSLSSRFEFIFIYYITFYFSIIILVCVVVVVVFITNEFSVYFHDSNVNAEIFKQKCCVYVLGFVFMCAECVSCFQFVFFFFSNHRYLITVNM